MILTYLVCIVSVQLNVWPYAQFTGLEKGNPSDSILEEVFILLAVLTAAASQLTAIGGVFGGNAKPTRFLCLILKLLQIQPDDEIVDELIKNDSFKYIK